MQEPQTPQNLEEAVSQIVNNLSPEDRDYIIKEEDSCVVHHFAGRQIRNDWNLWESTSPLNQWFRKNLGLGHADDISGIIFQMVWNRVKGQPEDITPTVEQYKKHWKEQGVDPLTGEKIEETSDVGQFTKFSIPLVRKIFSKG